MASCELTEVVVTPINIAFDRLADIQFCDNTWQEAVRAKKDTEEIVLCLAKCLDIARTALEQYAAGRTWRHYATDALQAIDAMLAASN